MNDLILVILFFMFILTVSIWSIYSILREKRTVKNISQKIQLYKAAELSFLNEEDITIPETIIVPFKSLMYGMLKKYFINIKKQYFLLSFIFIIALFSVPIFMKIPYFDMIIAFEIYFFVFIILMHIQAVSTELSFLEKNINFLHKYIMKSIKLDNKENLINEIKLDFDLYKVQPTINSIIIALLMPIILFYYKIDSLLSYSLAVFLMITIVLLIMMNFTYKKYRSNVIYISLQALNKLDINN